MRIFFPTQKAQLKAKSIDLDRVALTLIDGQRRLITRGVSLSITGGEFRANTEQRCFALHSTRGTVPANLVSFIRGYLFERGWEFIGGGVIGRGIWEGVFQK
jgi:hypothetical protein